MAARLYASVHARTSSGRVSPAHPSTSSCAVMRACQAWVGCEQRTASARHAWECLGGVVSIWLCCRVWCSGCGCGGGHADTTNTERGVGAITQEQPADVPAAPAIENTHAHMKIHGATQVHAGCARVYLGQVSPQRSESVGGNPRL